MNIAKLVVDHINEKYGGHSVEMLSDTCIILDGKRFDLDNLYKMMTHQKGITTESIYNYVASLFDTKIDSFKYFDDIRDKLMPRIYNNSIFNHLSKDMCVHTEWVNDCSIFYVVDGTTTMTSININNIKKWGVSIDEIDEIARENLVKYNQYRKRDVVAAQEGHPFILFSELDGYDASHMLHPTLWEDLSDVLGRTFWAAIPCRDMMSCWPCQSHGSPRLRDLIKIQNQNQPYPISEKLFLVTRDGIAGDTE